jgi:hypothetical protein
MVDFDTNFDYNNLINERTNSYEDEYNETMLFNIAYLTMVNFSLFVFFIGYLFKDIIYDISLYYYNLSMKDKNEVLNLSFNIKEPEYNNNNKLEYNENEEIEDLKKEITDIEDILENNDLVNYIENSEFSLDDFKIKKEKTIEDLLDDLMNADNYNNNICNIIDEEEEEKENEETNSFDFLKIYNFASNKKLN